MNLQGVNFLDQPVATPGSGSWGGFPSPTPGRRPSFDRDPERPMFSAGSVVLLDLDSVGINCVAPGAIPS